MGCCSSETEALIRDTDQVITSLIHKHFSSNKITTLSHFDKSNPDKLIIQIDNYQTSALGLAIVISDIVLVKYLHKVLNASFAVLEEQLQLQNIELIELVILNFNSGIVNYYLPIYLQHLDHKESVNLDHTLNFASICVPNPKKRIHPMRFAVEHNEIRFIKFIASKFRLKNTPECFDIHSVDEETGENCALVASRTGNLQMVEFLHRMKCDFKRVNKSGETAINLCLVPSCRIPGNISILPYLVEVVGLDISENYEETLMLCRNQLLVEYIEGKLRNRGIYVTKHGIEAKYQNSFSLANICQDSPGKISSVPSLISSISYQDMSITLN